MKNPLRKRYRVVMTKYCKYQVQVSRWWFPFYYEAWGCNSSHTFDEALALIGAHEFRKYVD